MTSNSLIENEEHNIPSHILKTIFNFFFWLYASVIFRPKYVCFLVYLYGVVIPNPSGQLAELIVYITSTRVDLYSHRILLEKALICNHAIAFSHWLSQGWVSSGRNLFLPGHPEKSGRNLFLPVLSGQNWKKLDKTVKDVRNVGRKYFSYLISYKRLWLKMHLVNRYCLKTWCNNIK